MPKFRTFDIMEEEKADWRNATACAYPFAAKKIFSADIPKDGDPTEVTEYE